MRGPGLQGAVLCAATASSGRAQYAGCLRMHSAFVLAPGLRASEIFTNHLRATHMQCAGTISFITRYGERELV